MVALRSPGTTFVVDARLQLQPVPWRRRAAAIAPAPAPAVAFDYHTAFSRNLGWTTPGEQELLRATRIGIAGLGPAGVEVLATLVRLGVGSFALADDDTRHCAAQALRTADINPEARIDRLGLDWPGVEALAQGATLVIDTLPPAAAGRAALHGVCRRAGVPVLVVTALGGAAGLCLLR
ncbi:MAG: hypothetical protein L6R48_25310, partial [Planctomycetes bacterium]|nr:hypothetical protein [Planctomycetota bacterium]